MEKNVFLKEYMDLMGISDTHELLTRNLMVAVSHADYGKPSMAILECAGSPPKLTIIVDVYPLWFDRNKMPNEPESHFFISGGAPVRANLKNRGKAIQLVYRYLIENGYISN